MDKYYENIKDELIKSELYDRIKDYSKDRNKVKVYYEIGKLLHEAGKEYGKNIISDYSRRLMVEVGNKYNYRTLYRMRKFYEIFSNQKLTPLVSKLSWSHYIEILTLKDINEIKYYIRICEKLNLTKRELHERIKSKEYYRLSNETRDKLISHSEVTITDTIPNPILIKDTNNYDKFSEYILKELISHL